MLNSTVTIYVMNMIMKKSLTFFIFGTHFFVVIMYRFVQLGCQALSCSWLLQSPN